MDLINRTKTAVRELDNLNYRKMKKILMADNRDSDLQSQSSQIDYESDINVSDYNVLIDYSILNNFLNFIVGRSHTT